MGTRSLTFIHQGDRDSTVLCAIYRQMDGYPSGMGGDIAKCLGGKRLVNGLPYGEDDLVNGMGCAAAQLIKELKDGPGSIYITLTDSEDDSVSYAYHLYFEGNPLSPGPDARLSMEVVSMGNSLWKGLLPGFDGAQVEAENSEE